MEEKNFLPEISRKELEKQTDNWDYIYSILDLFYAEIDKRWDEVYSELYDDQVILIIYTNLDYQVCNWWFVQMIYNWYWYQVFETTFIELIEKIWMKKTANLLKEAKVFYEKYKEKFENVDRGNWDSFANLYKEMPEFDKFSSEYYEINEKDLEILVKYVKENINDFVTLVD